VTRDVEETTSSVPAARLRLANDAPVARGQWVVYWMIATRRAGWNCALERAREWARALAKPLVVLEPLRAGYPWASERLHRFVLDGMAHNAHAFAAHGVAYWPYVEPRPGAGKGLLAALAARAALVVTDEFPGFFLPRMVAAAARQLGVRLEVVDSNGLVPLRATPGAFATAFAFRRWLQQHLAEHLDAFPLADPLRAAGLAGPPELAPVLGARWPAATSALLAGEARALSELPIDHRVAPVRTRGGSGEARRELESFVAHKLARYGECRDHPDDEGASGFSPYLHFGHLSAHEVFAAVTAAVGWKRARLSREKGGKRGWFGAAPSAEAFLEQLVTWRELGQGFAWHRPDHDRYESLPAWARATLEEHVDPRGRRYALEELESAATHDPIWNAAQTELITTGRLHNYLRMLWGKKILEWSPSPREALARMIHLNNKYALDGRDPNSYSGIGWCLGRFDRPWGPKRPVFGTVRYMSSENAVRKLELEGYLERFGPPRPDPLETSGPVPFEKRRRRSNPER
jgi:deoxyribodipyrimidine photo-lyase